MKEVYDHYRNSIAENGSLFRQLSRRIYTLGTLRLVIVLAAIATLVIWPRPGWKVSGIVILSYAVPFAALMAWYHRLVRRKEYVAATIKLCEAELAGLDYDFSAFDGAADKISGEHAFSLDLDLFGERSLFQSLNRTVTHEGREKLSEWFVRPLSDKQAILLRQQAVAELAGKSSLRQHFTVTGSLKKGTAKDTEILESLIGSQTDIGARAFWRAATWLVPVLWVVLFALLAANIIQVGILSLFFLLSVAVSNWKVGHVNRLHTAVGKMDKIFSVYARLIGIIEREEFRSAELREISRGLDATGTKASVAIKELSSALNTLDQRANMLAVILNIFLMRDIRVALRIDRWKKRYGDQIGRWLGALGDLDALSSLGGFAFNHPGYTYPAIADDYFEMEGTGLGHPLLDRNVCVRNDIRIEKAPLFLIVTGANMAGKSTYLRTVGVNFLLACTGAPVYAERLSVYPASLVTSLRTSDSLAANESYFYAELKRLKTIIDRLEAGEELFIILDEILKGTNSDDKQKGSLALVRQFISYRTCGIIATHDLVLGTLRDEFPQHVRNFRFEAEIDGDRLRFPYRLQEGIAKNLNACFLMKKMGITV